MIRKQNPEWTAQSNIINPDADMYLTEEQLGDFKVKISIVPIQKRSTFAILATTMSSMFWSS